MDIREAEGKLIIKPARKKEPTLKQLLAKVIKENIHNEIDTGKSVGNESW